jgi:hypothetical protein
MAEEPISRTTYDLVTVIARAVLLDALTALSDHLDALVLVGAQAIYLHTASNTVAVAAFTTDGDLVVIPERLGNDPLIERAMTAAGFALSVRGTATEPGTWLTTRTISSGEVTVPVDLIVPEGFATVHGSRSVTVGEHSRLSMRWTPGLEVAVIDHSPMSIEALDPSDSRVFEVNVAGPAALFIGKAFKLHERSKPGQRPDRLRDKDAADVYRLMQRFSPVLIADRLGELRQHDDIAATIDSGLAYLSELFLAARSPGINMVVSALVGAIDEGQIRTFAPAWMRDVINDRGRAT